MSDRGGYYGELKVEFAVPQAEPVATPSRPHREQEYLTEEDAIEANRAAYSAALQERGGISDAERVYRLGRFDQGDPVTMREAQNFREAQNLREARELAAAARSHEAAERAKVRERGGPER
jgi:hypothetical protein